MIEELSILIVDDNEVDRELYRSFMESDGTCTFHFTEAEDIAEGIEKVNENAFDCILLDYMLPDGTGLDFIRQCNNHDNYIYVPVLLLTGHGDESVAVESMKIGVADYLIKGKINADILIKAVYYALERKKLEKTQHEQHHLLNSLLEAIPNPIYYKNRNGEYLGCNRAFKYLVGHDKEEIIGKTIYDIVPKETADEDTEQDREVLKDIDFITDHFSESFQFRFGQALDKYRDVMINKAALIGMNGTLTGIVGIIVDITEQKRLEKQLQEISRRDGLTGVNNRGYFDEQIVNEWKRMYREKKPIAILMIDIDHFKNFNDSYGHQMGDTCLKFVADSIGNTASRPGDFVARYGGEEFIVILPETNIEGAQVVAERIRESVEKITIDNEGDPGISITVSLGVAGLPFVSDENPEELIALADKALYTAKNNGRNRVEIYRTS